MRVTTYLAGALFAFALSPVLDAQNVNAVIPNVGTGTATQRSSYPWNRKNGAVRVQYAYDSSELPLTSIIITRIKFRPWDGYPSTTTWTGGTYGGITMKMSTASKDHAAITTTFSTNHGSDVTTVYSGSVNLTAGAGTGTGVASKYYVDMILQKSFTYDPSKGDFLLDIASDGSKYVGGTTVPNAVTFTADGKKATRMFNLTSRTATTGNLEANVGLVAELTFTPVAGIYPNFDAVGVTRGPAPLKVGFKDNSIDTKGPITARLWDLDGDGKNDVTGNNKTPSFTYAKAGVYDVKLQVSGPSGTKSLTKKAVVTVCGATTNEGSITTLFASNNGGRAGWGNAFDVTVKNKNGVKITSVDVNSSSATKVSIDVYTTPGTYVGNDANAAVWTKVATGSATGVGNNVPTKINTNDFFLAPGKYGMFVHFASGTPRYTDGTATNNKASNCDIDLALGIGKSGLFTGSTVNPRIWNGTLHYDKNDKAANGPYGFGCPGAGSTIPELTISAEPVVGTSVKLNITGMTTTNGNGFVFIGLMVTNTDLTAIGMPKCALFNEALLALPFSNVSGSASLGGSIPNNASLLGKQIFVQSANADTGANALGVAASPGLSLRIGNK